MASSARFRSPRRGGVDDDQNSKVQVDWLPVAEVCKTPALHTQSKFFKQERVTTRTDDDLTLCFGLARTIAFCRSLGLTDLWTLPVTVQPERLAILYLLHAMLLRPSEIILPLDKFPVAAGTRSGFSYPHLDDFLFDSSGVRYRTALSNTVTRKNRVDFHTCTAAALDLEDAIANAPRAMRDYITVRRLLSAPPQTPVIYYCARDDGSGNSAGIPETVIFKLGYV